MGTRDDWTGLALGANEGCGLTAAGAVLLGDNPNGQLGDGSAQRAASQPVSGDAAWRSLEAGYYHTCAISPEDGLWCWGRNVNAQLGLGSALPTQKNVPVAVGASLDWQSVAPGSYHTCGLKLDGALWCGGRTPTARSATGRPPPS
jgi:alpha-tubulin suppressor-like RCC1 family protein